ncbi:MAG: DUF3667 domain-containing protein, partial [Alphaproteobacteria bacterium]|nr:DUF3667 domain-containing protein [Alphaproteobacteria bacterium]
MADDIEAILELGGVAAVEVAASHLAERGAKPRSCKNCAKPLLGAYCAVCGQPTKTRRRSVALLLHDFVVDIFNFDSKVLRTARALLFQPGELPKAFREGRTVPYTPAIRLYLFVSLIFFALLSLTNIAIIQLEVSAKPIKIVRDAQGNAFIANPAYDPKDKDPDTAKFIKPMIPIDKEKANRPGGLFNYSTEAYFFKHKGAVHSTLTPEQRARLARINDLRLGNPKQKKAISVFEKGFDGFMERLAADPAALNGPLTTWIPRA